MKKFFALPPDVVRETKQVEFIKKHLEEVIELCVQNSTKTGYVQQYVTKDFKLEFPPEFIMGKFDKSEFYQHEMHNIKNPEGKNIITIYYQILWSDNYTTWNIKREIELIPIPLVPQKSLLN